MAVDSKMNTVYRTSHRQAGGEHPPGGRLVHAGFLLHCDDFVESNLPSLATEHMLLNDDMIISC